MSTIIAVNGLDQSSHNSRFINNKLRPAKRLTPEGKDWLSHVLRDRNALDVGSPIRQEETSSTMITNAALGRMNAGGKGKTHKKMKQKKNKKKKSNPKRKRKR